MEGWVEEEEVWERKEVESWRRCCSRMSRMSSEGREGGRDWTVSSRVSEKEVIEESKVVGC